MKIYLAHPTSFDFSKELYAPLQADGVSQEHELVFPHVGERVDSKATIAACGLVIAEASFPSTGMGIELGWANDLGKRIVCIHRRDAVPTGSLKYVSQEFLEYGSSEELVRAVRTAIQG